MPSDCSLCEAFTPRAKQSRHADFIYYTNLLQAGGDIWDSDPPSKRKGKGKSKVRDAGHGSSSSKKQKTSNSNAPASQTPLTLEALQATLSGQLQRQMDSVRELVSGAVSDLRLEFMTHQPSSLSESTDPRSTAHTSSTASVREVGDSSGVSLESSRVTETLDTVDRAAVEEVSSDRARAFSGPVVAGPAIRPGDRHLIRACSVGPQGLTDPFSASVPGTGSTVGSDASASVPGGEDSCEVQMDVESVQEPEVLTYSSALGQMRDRLALILPQVVVQAPVPDPEKFRLPGEAFAPSKPSQAQLKILPSLEEEVIGPLLVGTRHRGDLPELDRRYGLDGDASFSIPVVDGCVYASVTLGASSAATASGGAGRKLPPFREAVASQKASYRSFEELYRNGIQQLRVSIYSAYLAALQRKTSELDSSSQESGLDSLGAQLTDIHSHLARDGVRSCASTLMAAVMGMRRLWLSVSRYSDATKRSLLALPYQLGSSLFPGAQAVISEAAEAVVNFKDSKPLLEQPSVSRRPSVLAASHPPPPKERPQWAAPMQRKRSRGRGRGKGAGAQSAQTQQQQPFRGRGKSS